MVSEHNSDVMLSVRHWCIHLVLKMYIRKYENVNQASLQAFMHAAFHFLPRMLHFLLISCLFDVRYKTFILGGVCATTAIYADY